MSTAEKVDTQPQTDRLRTSTAETLRQIREQGSSQRDVLGNILDEQRDASTSAIDLIKDQSGQLGSVLANILESFTSSQTDADEVASAAKERAAGFARSTANVLQEGARTLNTSTRPASVVSNFGFTNSTEVGSSRNKSLNTFGNGFGLS